MLLRGAAAPAGLAPNEIAGMVAWYKSDVGVFAAGETFPIDGEAIIRWEDQSGNNYHLTPPQTAPVYDSLAQNNLPAIDFGAASNLSDNFNTTYTQPNTIVMVLSDPLSAGVYYDGFSASQRHLLAGTLILAGASLSTSFSVVTSSITSTIYNGAATEFFLNGVLTTNGNAGTQSLSGLVVGSNYVGNAKSDISVYEIIVYDSALSTSDREALEAYLNTKYSIN